MTPHFAPLSHPVVIVDASYSYSSKLLVFDGPEESLRSPSPLPWLDGVALRDLVLHETHAACVDARGDVYQWGNVSAQGSVVTQPIRTLRGKVRAWSDFLLDNWGPLIVIHPEH